MGTTDLQLLDAGDMIREKRMRIGLLDKATVVVRIVASLSGAQAERATHSATGRAKRWLEAGSSAYGILLSLEEDEGLLDVGFPVVVQLAEGARPDGLQPGQPAQTTVSETPRGFLVV